MGDIERGHRVGLKGRFIGLLLKLFRVRPAVRFTDTRLLADESKPPPFDTQRGEFLPFGVVILGDGTISSGDLPTELDCPSDFVIYASNAEWLFTCQGFGPDDAVVATARQNADAVAAGITCTGGCVKSVEEIWRGWSCEWLWDFGMFLGTAAVELRVSCVEL